MKMISAPLFDELCKTSARIDTGWLVVRQDGERFAFTTSDEGFTYNGDVYTPANGFNASAVVSKADASVDNMETQVLTSDTITELDLRGGVWANATVQVFWLNPDHPEYGIIPLRGGILGEVVVKNGQFTSQLRSLFQQMQQPFGYFYTLQCGAQLGDVRCKVKLAAPVWSPNTVYPLGLLSDAKWGAIVQPTANNDFWYVANYTTITEQELRPPTAPGAGLSGNDDLGPNDQTQVAVGAPPDNLGQFTYTGDPVDVFGIKLAVAFCFIAPMLSWLHSC
jgi:hypothetical protein